MTDQLRSALGADADTPAGVDVGAVRDRARSLRRRRTTLVAGAAAVVAATAIVVPAGLLGGAGSGPDTGPATEPAGTAATLACPDAIPARPANTGAGLGSALVPFTADDALVCAYDQLPRGTAPALTGVLRLAPAEAAAVAAEVNGGSVRPPEMCTADIGVPIVLAARGEGRTVTVTLQPFGCGQMTNGISVRSGRTQFLRDLRDKARQTSVCPARLRSGDSPVPDVVPADPGETMLPAGTTRLLLCGYRDQDPPRTDNGWDAAVDGDDVTPIVRRINAAPPADGLCSTEGGAPEILITAVAPDRVKRVLVQVGNCRAFSDGARSVHDQDVAELLLRRVQQR